MRAEKTWEGTTTMGSDADLPDAPSRIWKGLPASWGICSMGKDGLGRKCAPTSTMPSGGDAGQSGRPDRVCHG